MKDKKSETDGMVFGPRMAKETFVPSKILIPDNPKVEAKALPVKSYNPEPGYEVILDQSIDGLVFVIEEYLKAGWECAGGVSYSAKMGLWYQAITTKDRK